MSNKHQEKFMTKLLFGITAVSVGIFLIMYFSFNPGKKEDWYFWGIVAAICINAGLVAFGGAFVHKIKSDLIRRQKQREQQKTFTPE